MSNTSSKGTKKPSIYVDTCIALDVTERHRAISIELLARVKNNGWTCKMSIFGMMELIDIAQESLFVNKRFFIEKQTLDEIISSRKHRDLEQSDLKKSFQSIKQFATNYSFIEMVGLTDDGWDLAGTVAIDSNLHASDVIHLVSAWQADCDLVVTDDTFFIKEAGKYLKQEGVWDRLRVCSPEKCYSVLKEMGYTDI